MKEKPIPSKGLVMFSSHAYSTMVNKKHIDSLKTIGYDMKISYPQITNKLTKPNYFLF